ncbi:MAG TPA: uroporphyrinogen-III C-methyltransferase [Candidatus Angelobacter sp.]|nr:uroporphyrinogen-III C-methyltransferase [Candidatus Angelobacter sp.]
MTGKVSIVGAGPGAADLLTVRAAEALRSADVVLHDDLVSAEVLALCPPRAQIVNAGKRCGRQGSSQEEINQQMVDYALRGLAVVRLKSGDPSVYGRLGEELDALREAGISFHVIPGVTAASAAAAAAEITLTDRRKASALVVLTGHNADDEIRQHATLDPERTTYAVYMPGPDYARTARELVNLGIDPATPCALVSHAGRSTQQVRFLSIEGLGSARGIIPPAVLIVGRVAQRNEFSEILKSLAGNTEAVPFEPIDDLSMPRL